MAKGNLNLIDKLQVEATRNKVLILSFIAPDTIVKVSPIGIAYASISIEDLYQIEKIVEELEKEKKLPKNLHLVIQSPGGLVNVSTKIAKYLQNTFDEIHAFVPYEASSGGTMLCLSANKITMGRLANLSPIDPQTRYLNQRVSVTSYQQAINEFTENFGKMRPGEIPPPYQQLCEKLDPIILKEMNRVWIDTVEVGCELLQVSYEAKSKDEIQNIRNTVLALTFSSRPHSHIIDIKEAKLIGLKIDDSKENQNLLNLYKEWISGMLKEEFANHIIKRVVPVAKKKNAK